MSRQNKVNPGTYTQRGRLTQDDAARELRKQSAIGSPHTWQPVNTKTRPWPAQAGGAVDADVELCLSLPGQVRIRRAGGGSEDDRGSRRCSHPHGRSRLA